MSDPGRKVKDFRLYTWRVSDWFRLDKSVKSPEFECGDHKWRILLCPFGNALHVTRKDLNNIVSVYLECATSDNAPENCRPLAQFALVISNIHDPSIFTIANFRHQFNSQQYGGWGSHRFAEWNSLFYAQWYDGRPTIQEGAANVAVYLRVLEHSSSTCAPCQVRTLKKDLDTANSRAREVANDHKAECRLLERAFKAEIRARFEAEDRLHTQEKIFDNVRTQTAHLEKRLRTREAVLEEREANIRAAEEEILAYQVTIRAMDDAAKMHAERLSAHVPLRRRSQSFSLEGEPPAKRHKVEALRNCTKTEVQTTIPPVPFCPYKMEEYE
ncbi:TRAF-like protein [Mycena crocata]|nr:TRAF-like protein [Mycena crocata]